MDNSSEEGSTPDVALIQSSDVRRQTTPTACQQCRQKKQRCDGQRPCAGCVRRGGPCTYTSNMNETPRQATKRKFGQLEELINSLKSDDPGNAAELLQRIRAGESYESILDRRRHIAAQSSQIATSQSQQEHTRTAFLLFLAQSTLSLAEIQRLIFAAFGDETAAINLPTRERYESLASCKVSQKLVHSLLEEANPDRQIQAPVDTSYTELPDIIDGSYRGVLHWLPPTPWVRSPISADTVSHLVSLFLCWFNPYWRWVEEDLFISAMRSQSPTSEFCSPFLVAAIMSFASQFADIREVYESHGERLNRGEQFYEEAMRLWRVEGGKPTLVNLQALCILSYDACFRGRDRVGWNLMSAATGLNNRLEDFAKQDSAPSPDYTRARRLASVACIHLHATFAIALWRNSGVPDIAFDQDFMLESLLPDTLATWTPFPQSRHSIPYRCNLMLRERCKLTKFMVEVNRLLLPRGMQTPDLESSIHGLGANMRVWYETLPGELALEKSSPVAIYDFHLQCIRVLLSLYKEGTDVLFGSNADRPDVLNPSEHRSWTELRRRSLNCVFRGVSIIRDYRETYGLKISTWPWHLAISCTFVLLRDLRIFPRATSTAMVSPPLPSISTTGDLISQDPLTALEECFRCLVTVGMSIVLPRAVVRMAYLTAQRTNVALPISVQQWIEVLGELAWQSADLHRLNSSYPNTAISRAGATIEEGSRMDDLMLKWEGLDVKSVKGGSSDETLT